LAVKFLGTIVTFDSGYSLWRHSDIIVMVSSKRKRNNKRLYHFNGKERRDICVGMM
jgi:hypothetical protein